jgi:nucleosome assembly protein 1-like 1
MSLQDVRCTLHDQGYGFDLTFHFEKNDYFSDEVLKKTFVMSRQNVIEKCEGSEIQWKDGKDITKKKVKKKQNKKKNTSGAKTVTKTVEQESFFNFFKTHVMPEEKDLVNINEEEEKELGEKMDEDFDLGNEFKDQLIPLALEYYMGVIEHDEEDDEDHDSDECGGDCGHGHGGGNKDSDDDDDKGGKKKGGKKAAKKGGQEGGQQECKQQ